MITRPALVAASLVTSWSPAKAEIIGQPFSIRLTWEEAKDRDEGMQMSQFNQKFQIGFDQSYLNSLSVVGLHNMEAEAVHASPWCQEDAGFLVKMSSHVHQNLAGLGGGRGAMWC